MTKNEKKRLEQDVKKSVAELFLYIKRVVNSFASVDNKGNSFLSVNDYKQFQKAMDKKIAKLTRGKKKR